MKKMLYSRRKLGFMVPLAVWLLSWGGTQRNVNAAEVATDVVSLDAADRMFQAIALQRLGAQPKRARWRVVDWYSANLDEKPDQERVALLCSETEGFFLVEKELTHWEIRFPVDGRTTTCTREVKGLPRWQVRRVGHLQHFQGHHGGYHETWLAIRVGIPAVVLRRKLDDGLRGDAALQLDYDLLARQGKLLGWPAVDDKSCAADDWCAHGFDLRSWFGLLPSPL